MTYRQSRMLVHC